MTVAVIEVPSAEMRFAISPTNAGPFGDPRVAATLAVAAEEAGWDGYFSWDSMPTRLDPPPTHDPWVILSAVAAATRRITIGTCVAVLPRYKPHLLARTLVSLDGLSNGRLVLGVGLGGDGGASLTAFGEDGDATVRAQKTDEALEVMTRLWAGEPVSFRGTHYSVEDFTLSARPVQKPRIPIWVGGDSPAAMRRAARWDGWIGPDARPLESTADDAVEVRRRLESLRGGAGIDIAWGGSTSRGIDSVRSFHEAGVTWWIEVPQGSPDEIMARVQAGPPST